jgi:hypothetical protein
MTSPFTTVVGIILFLYLTWRNLKDNYKTDDLITYSWVALLAFLVGGRITYGLANWGEWESFGDWIFFYRNPGINLPGGYVVLLMMTTWLVQKYDWKIWPFLEEMIGNMTVLVFSVWLGMIDFSNTTIGTLSVGGIFIFCWGMSMWIKNQYRSFVWYRSGKKGFGFFFTNAIFFLFLSIYFLINKERIFFGVLLSVGLINMIGLFILGEVFEPLLVKIKRKRI